VAADDFKAGVTGVDVGGNPKAIDVNRRARFEPDCLPNAAGGGVPFPLFADGLLGIVHRILNADHERGVLIAVVGGFERVGDVEFVREIAAFAMADVLAVHPNVGKEIGGADGENGAFAVPRFVFWDGDFFAIPAHLVAWGFAMIFAGDFERVPEYARRVKIIIAGGVAFAPGGEGFPWEWDQDLFAPNRAARFEPAFFFADSIAIESELPWSI